ncbi:MAG TPA: hypothetical protein VK858_11340 [Longimicrobiales bacterium]|nr:hypothetical protein [Longimicrobiales bacterium]
MADVDPKLMAFVEAELKKSPDISTNDLFDKAKKKHPAAAELSVRQFHARYPLQVKRRMSLAKGGGRRKPRRKTRRTARRDAVREALLRFATDLSAAEERKDIVKLMSEMDRYVDDVLEAAKR